MPTGGAVGEMLHSRSIRVMVKLIKKTDQLESDQLLHC